jgi:hypothetical protein
MVSPELAKSIAPCIVVELQPEPQTVRVAAWTFGTNIESMDIIKINIEFDLFESLTILS